MGTRLYILMLSSIMVAITSYSYIVAKTMNLVNTVSIFFIFQCAEFLKVFTVANLTTKKSQQYKLFTAFPVFLGYPVQKLFFKKSQGLY